MREAVGLTTEYFDITVKTVYKLLTSNFSSKEALNAKRYCMLWNPTFNCAVDQLDLLDHEGGEGHYSSTKR